MKHDIPLWQFGGFVFTALAGTLLHFLYEWTNNALLVSPVSGVNESTWEHIKLLFFPLAIFALIQSRFLGDIPSFWQTKFCGALLGILLIPVLFYTYNGAFGQSPDWLNIAFFFVAAAVVFLWETPRLQAGAAPLLPAGVAIAGLIILGALFITFTFAPPHLPLFRDPINGTYGIAALNFEKQK